MKVFELIKFLEKLPPDTEVVTIDYFGETDTLELNITKESSFYNGELPVLTIRSEGP